MTDWEISSKKLEGRKGRHRINIYDDVIHDLKNVGLNFESAMELAKNETEWELRKNYIKPNRRPKG